MRQAHALYIYLLDASPTPSSLKDPTSKSVLDHLQIIPYDQNVTYYSHIQLNSYAVGRMERFFKDPLKFDPDRFHPDAPK